VISEWDQPAELETPSGSLLFNQPLDTTTSRAPILNPRRCSSVLPVRITDDDVPQGDGKIPHRRFRSGYQAHIAIEIYSAFDFDTRDAEPASGADLVELEDMIGLHVNEMIRTGLVPGSPNARYIWSPTDQSEDRMLDRCQLAGDPTYSFDGDLGCALYEIDIDTGFPYYAGVTENINVLDPGDTDIITNEGNTDFFPVVEVQGDIGDGFTIENQSVLDMDGNAARLVYDATLPGASAFSNPDYVEFIFFQGTAYLNGNQANMKAGIDFNVSDWFPLIPGDNVIEFTASGSSGTTEARVIWQHAWA